MLESLQALDRTVFLALNGMHTPYWDSFMYIFTSKLVWIPLYVSILYLSLIHIWLTLPSWEKRFYT